MRRTGVPESDQWWLAKKGEVHTKLLPYVEKVERVQSAMFDRFLKLASLYDPYSPLASVDPRERERRESYGLMQENVIASNCDSIAGTLAATEIGARFPTDGGTWSQQRQAKRLDWYAEGLAKLLDADPRCQEAFHAGSLKGTGFVE